MRIDEIPHKYLVIAATGLLGYNCYLGIKYAASAAEKRGYTYLLGGYALLGLAGYFHL